MPVAAFGKSGQFQSGQFNEYGRLLSARSRHKPPTRYAVNARKLTATVLLQLIEY
jgi:hypothetical protein